MGQPKHHAWCAAPGMHWPGWCVGAPASSTTWSWIGCGVETLQMHTKLDMELRGPPLYGEQSGMRGCLHNAAVKKQLHHLVKICLAIVRHPRFGEPTDDTGVLGADAHTELSPDFL
jgi:hypothetical protein